MKCVVQDCISALTYRVNFTGHVINLIYLTFFSDQLISIRL